MAKFLFSVSVLLVKRFSRIKTSVREKPGLRQGQEAG